MSRGACRFGHPPRALGGGDAPRGGGTGKTNRAPRPPRRAFDVGKSDSDSKRLISLSWHGPCRARAARAGGRRGRDSGVCRGGGVPARAQRRARGARCSHRAPRGARALAALERELAALDEETLRGSGASAPPPPRRDHAGSSGDSLASGSGSGTSYADAERPLATASARDGDDATHGDVRRSAEPTFFPGTSRVTDASDEKEKDVCEDEFSERAETKARTPHGSGSDSTPDFFASTKFFACLELEESRELFDDAAETIEVPPRTVVFRQGDDSSAGIYVVGADRSGCTCRRSGRPLKSTRDPTRARLRVGTRHRDATRVE